MLKTFIPPAIPFDPSGESTRLARLGMLAVAVFFGGLGIWSVSAPLSSAIVASGTIKIDMQRKTIQHYEGGIVKEIMVREGSIVGKEQPLLILEDALTRSNMNILEAQYKALQGREARLLTEKNLGEKISFPSDLSADGDPRTRAMVATEKALFQTRRKALDDQIKLLREEIQQGRQAIPHFDTEIQAIREGIDFGGKQLQASRKLLEKKFVSESEIWKLETAQAEKRERLSEKFALLAQTKERLAELDLRISIARNSYVAEADSELKEVKKEMIQVEEQRGPAQDAFKRHVITAPLAGQVIDLKVTTVGGVVKAGEPLMDIVPTTRDMLMEARVKNNDIDSIHLNQEADVQLSAFNARTTPLIHGKVVYVSGDALVDANTREPYYLTHVRVSENDLKPVADLPMSPGMPITVFIKTKSRTFYQYLLAPVSERMRKAIREE